MTLSTLILVVAIGIFCGPFGVEDLFNKIATKLGLQSRRESGDEYLGKECVLVQRDGDEIRVKLQDATWSATLSDPNESVEVGDRMIIVKVVSTRFWVRKMTGNQDHRSQ